MTQASHEADLMKIKDAGECEGLERTSSQESMGAEWSSGDG